MTARLVPETVEVEPSRKPSLKRLYRRKWFTFTISGSTWTVHLVHADIVAAAYGEANPIEGLCNESASEILIQYDLPRDRIKQLAIHEILHAAGSSPASVTVLAKLFGCPAERVNRIEDNYVSYIAPPVWEALAPYLKFPRIPKGAGL